MADPVLFNQRFELVVVPTVALLNINDKSIGERKRAVCVSRLKSKAKVVPVVDIDTTKLFQGRPALLELARFARFTHTSTRKKKSPETSFYDENGMIYDFFITARGNGLYSCFLEMPQRKSDATLLYMPHADTEKEKVRRKKLIAVIQAAVKEWVSLCQSRNAAQDLRNRVRDILANDELKWRVSATNWAAYVNHCLFENPESRLHMARDRLLQNRFRIVALDPDDETLYQWESLVRAYMKLHPKPSQMMIDKAGSQSSMVVLPFPYYILDHSKITLVVLDCADENNIEMAGYTTCSVRSIESTSETAESVKADPFYSAELNLFVNKMSADANSGKERDDCGYDILSIEGAHVPFKYRGMGLFPKMLEYVMEFVANAHRTLGVSIVIADSLAAATKSELVKLGFSHYNVVTSLEWLNLALVDYAKILDGVEKPKFQTPPKYLTIDGIYGLLEQFCRVYTDGATKPESKWVLKANRTVKIIMAEWETCMMASNGEDFLRRKIHKRIETIEKRQEKIEESKAFKAYDLRVSTLMHSSDTEDTLFFIDKSLTDDEIFARQSPPQPPANVAPEVVPEEKNEEEDLRQAEPTITTDDTATIVVNEPPFDARPDAEDLVLYDMWLLVDKPIPAAFVTVKRRIASDFVFTEEERVRESRSIEAEEKYIRSLVQGLNRQIGATRLYINLRRNRPHQ